MPGMYVWFEGVPLWEEWEDEDPENDIDEPQRDGVAPISKGLQSPIEEDESCPF